MSFPDIIDLCSDEETVVADVNDVNYKLASSINQVKARYTIANNQPKIEEYVVRQGFEESRSPDIVSRVPNGSGGLDVGANGFFPVSASPGSSVPLCRQFWKAGDYETRQALGSVSQNGQNRLRVHPKFLHSNATSHKWAFGAIAELLDNAVDEVQNGATFVIVDKITNPQSGHPALLIQDNGGGMDPTSLRRCISFGFSDKSDSSIGQYGNGFKTSTMRLGADVIVFSRCMNRRTLTQSVGLLSYTFLRQTGWDDIVVPMVDYEFDLPTGVFQRLLCRGQKQFSSNLSMLLQWSPFASEAELLKQFNDIGHHGTKVIVFNLWFNDEGDTELDFESDAKDIMINGARKAVLKNKIPKTLYEKHIANRLRYSLRVYSSILYLHLPESFRIILRGQTVEPHHLVNDLKYLECIKYKPQVEGSSEAVFITTIGFLEDAPNVAIHGFNVYHKNRLILPFWRVVGTGNSKGRGVAGVLEANFIKPTHDKQDFEKSTLYQKLETRLKEMTLEYWDYHCHLVGYPIKNTPPSTLAPATAQKMSYLGTYNGIQKVVVNGGVPPVTGSQVVTALTAPTHLTPGQFTNFDVRSQKGLPEKRRHESHITAKEPLKRQALASGTTAGVGRNSSTQLGHGVGQRRMQEIRTIMEENKKLHAQCSEYEKSEKELLLKAQKLRSELQEVQQVYTNLNSELKSMGEVKVEK